MFVDTTVHPALPSAQSPAPFPGHGVQARAWWHSPRLTAFLLILLALVPILYMLSRTADARRNIVYWDEFDTALALVLKLKQGTTPTEFFHDLFAVSNEHRMVTSRLMFATSYWTTGTVNFSVISIIGNASIIALCVMLVVAAGTTARRLRLGLLLAALMFQLEHYENFLWSGSSIDHFQVVLLAGAALVAAARGTTGGVVSGAVFATLATFTLAHGIVVWPVGAAMLLRTRNWRGLAWWAGLGSAAVGAFLIGFKFNAAQEFASPSIEGALEVAHYWLALLGAVPALGNDQISPLFGGVLLGLVTLLAWRGSVRREAILFPLVAYAIGAMALIAIGRAAESHGVVFSRYFVLSALAWALVLFMILERYSHPRRPLQLLFFSLPVLVAFNLTANQKFAAKTDTWLECRDRAVLRFKQHGVDGRGPFSLHPAPERATAMLNEAERLGIYRLGTVCLPRSFPDAQPSTRISYYVDEMTVSPRSASLAGWAAIKGERAKRGQIHLVLRNDVQTYIYTTVTVTRPDVADAEKQVGWRLAGFRFARRRDQLPDGDFQVGFLIKHGSEAEYVMTAHRVRLVGEGQALLATGD